MHEEKQTKKWVWVPHNSLTYIPAFINTQTEKEATVTTQDNQTLTLPISKIQKMNPPKFNQADDLAVLSFLNDPSVLYNLKMRYDHDLIYTYSGFFLVAINPYKEIRSLYSKETIESYKNKKQPHIFAIANDAYENMLTNKEDQSILITGESGAGKTVNTKKVITFLAHIANKEQMDSSVTEELIASKILETNHVLEAFGNAQTVKNDNSSRFGKFIKISFVNGKITGCYIEKYLLEKSRITRANSDERNYHIFYYLLEALRKNEKYQRKNSKGEFDNEMTDKNRYQSKMDENSKRSKNYANDLGDSSYKYGGNVYDKEYVEFLDVVRKAALFDSVSLNDYKYTKDTQKTINDVDDALEFYKLNRSMDILEFTRDEKISIFKILAVILYLGNLEFKEENDQAYIENEDEAEKICQLLKIPLKRFLNTLLTPTTMAGKDVVINSRTKEQVVNIVEALARLLYERMFDTIIERVNTVLGKEKYYNKSDSNFIGVLDIAGFEIFEKNDFEQLCINFTNEKLQQFFNHHMFILEQEIYKRENIDWDFIDFGLDLQPTIDLIEKSNPIGVLSFLDEECVMPKGSDLTFLDKLREIQDRGNVKARKRVTFSGVNYQVADSSSTSVKTKDEQKTVETLSPYKKQTFELSKLKSGFIIDHYAGRVEYIVDQWLKKNKDPHFDYLAVLLRHSDDAFVSELFTFDTSGKKGFFRTVSQKHKDSLNLLMSTLRKTNPFFVRCILPNNQKKPNLFINSLVLHQLKCNGVMEGIRISRQGYPTRILFKEFRKRYGMLCKEIEDHIDNKEASLTILESVEHCLPCVNENNTDVAIPGNEKKGSLSDLYKVGNTMLFFKQGVLAEIEDLRDREIEKIAVEIQSLIRRRLAIYKEHMEEIRSNAVKIIQKNARLSIQFRSWNWWKLFMKVKPLLNISKMEDEIRQKECDFNALNETLKMERMRNEEMINRMKRETDEKGRLENELENERMIICEKEDLLIALRNEIVKIKDKINDKNSEIEKLKEKLEAENKTREETGNKYEEKMKHLTSENLSLRDKNKLLEVNMSKLQNDEIKTMSKLVAEKESEIEDLRNELEEKSKKQAEQIKEQEMRIVENVRVYEEKINALNSKIHDLSEQESKGKSENEKLKNKVSGLEAENQKYVIENKKCKSEIVDLIENVEDLEDQKNALLNDNNKLKNKLNKLREEIEVEMTKSGTFSNSNNELNDRIQDLMKENERMKNDLEEEKERAAFLNARNEKAAIDFKKTLQTRLDQIDTLEQDFNAQKSKLRARVAQLESENKLLQNRTNNVDSKLFDVQVSRRKELENEFRDLESKYISLMHINDTDRIEKLNMEKKIAKLQSQLEESENKNEKLNSYINEVEQIKQAIGDKLKNQNDSFYKMLQEYRDENFALKEKINALNDSIEDKKKENSDVEKSIGELTNKNEKLEKEIKDLQQSYTQEKDKLNQQNSQLKQDIKDLNEKTKIKDEELALTRNNIKKLTESAKDVEKKLKDLDMQYKKESKQYKDDIAKLTEFNSSLESKLGNLKFTNDGEYICNHCTYDNCVCDENCLIKCNKVNQHLKTIGDLKMQLSYEQDRNRLLKEQNNKLQYNYDTFTGEYNELFDSLKNYRTNIERLQKELYLNIDLLRNKENELMSIKGSNASLVEDNKNLKKMCEKLQSKSIFTREHKTSNKVYEESIAIEKTLRFEAEDQIKRLREEIENMAKTNAMNLSKFNEVKRRNNEVENEMNLVRKEFIDMRKLYNEALQSIERLQRELKDERIIRQHSGLFTK